MFRPMSSASHSRLAEYSPEECDEACQPGTQPTETYKIM
jgi:hypothetical protein